MQPTVDPVAVKAESEAFIRARGGRICDGLPSLERTGVRPREQIVGRALVMNMLLNIYFKAPTSLVKQWIDTHGLSAYLSPQETQILARRNEDLSKQELINLYWYLEALWALMWVGGLIDDLPYETGIEDRMSAMCPDLNQDEGPEKFSARMRIRPRDEIFRMLDRYFRLHWWTRDGQLKGYATDPANLSIVMERRKALEWVLDPECEWDAVPLNT